MFRPWIIGFILLIPGLALAQPSDLVLNEDEITAWQLTQGERYVSARKVAEDLLKKRPRSVIGHTVTGMIQRYGEGNLPRSLYHLKKARHLLERRYGRDPRAFPSAAEWHNRILMETAFTSAEMERFEEELVIWDVRDKLYQPPMPGERIWPLMQLRRFDEARAWAAKSLADGRNWSRRQALNGLCALENEAGNRALSYRWCIEQLREIEGLPGYGGVYFCNAGESARGLFLLEEAEQYYLEATRRDVEWYANPWLFLAELYLRGGRLAVAADAVRSMNAYSMRRPPHTQQQDQSERNRVIASLYIVAGRPEKALPLTERAVLYPDRRGGQSRSPEADLVTSALFDRRAAIDAAQVVLEKASSGGFFERVKASFEAIGLQTRAWSSGRRAISYLEDEDLFRGFLEAEGRISYALPPWLVVDLIHVAGPGPVEASLDQIRQDLSPELATMEAYLDAYGAEAAAARGDWDLATTRARSAIEELPSAETLLRTRMRWLMAQSLEQNGDFNGAVELYLNLIQVDPTLIRRTGTRLPLRIAAGEDQLSQRTAEMLRRSPRVRLEASSPLVLTITSAGGSTCTACLSISGVADAGCKAKTVDDGSDVDEAARQCTELFHDRLLGPEIDMSIINPTSLDGATTTGTIDDLLRGTAP